jgi:uncharacterized lipoprotein YmbA
VTARVPLTLAALLLASGCAHSPEPVFYALSARPGAPHRTTPLVVELRRPSLPAYLDRQDIVRRATRERLDLGSDPRWAAPLDELTSNALAADLTTRLPSCFIVTEGHGIAATPDLRVELEITRFELDEHGELDLDALIAVRTNAPESRPLLQQEHFVSAPPAGDTAGTVAGMSEILARLADAIAGSVEQVRGG